MNYGDDNIFTKAEKTIILAKNGDSTINTKLKFKGKLDFFAIISHIEKKLGFSNVKKFRLFNSEGVELFEQDIDFINDKETIYVSRGEDFDYTSYYSEYEIVKTLGQGGFGKVVLGQHKQTKEKVAIKMISIGNMVGVDELDMIYTESGVLKSLVHDNIVKIKNFFNLKNNLTIFIMEYCEGGELLKYVDDRGHLEEDDARLIFNQILSAISYCHRHRIIHRDLKLENILFSNLNDKIIKVVDFGIAGLCAGANAEKTLYGSRYYSAPELLNKKNLNASFALDVWAMGIILYYMLVGAYPFNGKGKTEKDLIESLRDQILFGEIKYPSKLEKSISYEAKNIIKRMLDKDADTRISTMDIHSHPWIKKTQMLPHEESKHEEAVTAKEGGIKDAKNSPTLKFYNEKDGDPKKTVNKAKPRKSETQIKIGSLTPGVKRQSMLTTKKTTVSGKTSTEIINEKIPTKK